MTCRLTLCGAPAGVSGVPGMTPTAGILTGCLAVRPRACVTLTCGVLAEGSVTGANREPDRNCSGYLQSRRRNLT
jgi:hypothetical protein